MQNENVTKQASGIPVSSSRIPFKSVFPGKYIQGEGIVHELPGIMRSFGDRGLILASRTAREAIFRNLPPGSALQSIKTEIFNGECCEEELSRISNLVQEHKINVLVGAGGGKVIDTAKIVADRAGIPVVIVPTIASTDAPCSGCAVIYSADGVFEKVHYQKMNPQVVLVDVEIIINAPVRFLIAGMGDALATWFEARSCHQTNSKNECGGLSTLAGLALAELCYKTILKYGTEAIRDARNKSVTPAFHYIVEANTLLSGIGFESSGLASAHAIHNGLSALPATHSFYHGEKVAFGVLAGLFLTGAPEDEVDTVCSFCESVGLPTTFGEIGLSGADRDMLYAVALKSCAIEEAIHHESGNITPEKVIEALMAADAAGLKRKSGGLIRTT
jgi:glycerol dehydrogenase